MRHGKFCPKCGKSVEELKDGLCEGCFVEKMELPDKVPDKVVLGTCKMCRRVYMGDKKFDSEEQAVEDFLRNLLKQREVRDATYRLDRGVLKTTIDIESKSVGKRVEKSIPLVNKSITCRFCSLQKASYYNVTIQVRVPKDMEKKVMADIEDEMARLNRRDNYAFISGVQRLKEGTDLFVGSKSAADHVASMMKSRYGATVKISRKLYGLIEGKKSYRDTVLVSVKK